MVRPGGPGLSKTVTLLSISPHIRIDIDAVDNRSNWAYQYSYGSTTCNATPTTDASFAHPASTHSDPAFADPSPSSAHDPVASTHLAPRKNPNTRVANLIQLGGWQ